MERQFLQAIAALCAERGEAEDHRLALQTGLALTDVRAAIERLEEQGLIEVEEFGFSCFAEYTVQRVTGQGMALLNKSI